MFSQKPNDKRITDMQDILLKIQNDISNLTEAVALVGDSESSKILQGRLSTLENEFQVLQRKIDEERRENLAENEKLHAEIATLINHYNLAERQMNSLRAETEKRNKEEAKRNIVAEIRGQRFLLAESLIHKLNDNENIHNIVHDVYAYSEENFSILLDCAIAIKDGNLSWYVLNALWHEMRSNCHCDPYKIISLEQCLRTKILNQKSITAEIKHASEKVISEVIDGIERVVTETLKTAMNADNYKNNVEVKKLTEAIFKFNADISNKVMRGLVRETYKTVSPVEIADNLHHNTHSIGQVVTAMEALFLMLKKDFYLFNKYVATITYYLKKEMDMINYKNIPEEQKQSVNRIIIETPSCARNLAFSKTICLWNRGTNQFYPPPGCSKGNFRKGYWHVELSGGKFLFKNKVKANEVKKNDFRLWLYPDLQDSAWFVELHGDYCYLKNNDNDYLNACTYESEQFYCCQMPNPPMWEYLEFQWEIKSGD